MKGSSLPKVLGFGWFWALGHQRSNYEFEKNGHKIQLEWWCRAMRYWLNLHVKAVQIVFWVFCYVIVPINEWGEVSCPLAISSSGASTNSSIRLIRNKIDILLHSLHSKIIMIIIIMIIIKIIIIIIIIDCFYR